MTPDQFLHLAVDPALWLLPEAMRTNEARALITGIALQESKLVHRRQFAGPARSYVQFELVGIEGVLTNEHTWAHARSICLELDVSPTGPGVYIAIEYQDVLACVFARLLLWTLPDPLPARGEPDKAWDQYQRAWRPGRPRRETWNANCIDAWAAVQP